MTNYLYFITCHLRRWCPVIAYSLYTSLTHTVAYHKDQGAEALSQGLTEQQVADLEEVRQFVQVDLLTTHVGGFSGWFLGGLLSLREERSDWDCLEWLQNRTKEAPLIEPR